MMTLPNLAAALDHYAAEARADVTTRTFRHGTLCGNCRYRRVRPVFDHTTTTGQEVWTRVRECHAPSAAACPGARA